MIGGPLAGRRCIRRRWTVDRLRRDCRSRRDEGLVVRLDHLVGVDEAVEGREEMNHRSQLASTNRRRPMNIDDTYRSPAGAAIGPFFTQPTRGR
jgi:hypothetical protein